MSNERTGPTLLDCAVVTTRSGAPAIVDRVTGELMHPVVGPRVEAQQLYVMPSRLRERLLDTSSTREALTLLDVGLGAGGNAIAAWHLSESLTLDARPLSVVSFDRSLDALRLAATPQHAADFDLHTEAGVAARALIEHNQHTTARTSWRYVDGELLETLAAQREAFADVVYWDPFSPRENPALWSMHAFTLLRRACRDGVTVHTYSGATAIRSALLLAGFVVGVGNEVGPSKQNTCAALRVDHLAQPLDRRWLERLSRSSAGLPFDASADALERIAALPQFRLA